MVTQTKSWILILAAEETELQALRPFLAAVEFREVGPIHLQLGQWHSHPVLLTTTGVGKVAAAATCAALLTMFDVKEVLNIGTAGGISPRLAVMDYVLANAVAHADVDLTIFQAYDYGQLPGMPVNYLPSVVMGKDLQQIALHRHVKIHTGLMLSGDQFMHRGTAIFTNIERYFSAMDPLSFDMESAAVAQCCTVYKKPFGILRVISDIIENGDQVIDYQEVVERSSGMLAELLNDWFAQMR